MARAGSGGASQAAAAHMVGRRVASCARPSRGATHRVRLCLSHSCQRALDHRQRKANAAGAAADQQGASSLCLLVDRRQQQSHFTCCARGRQPVHQRGEASGRQAPLLRAGKRGCHVQAAPAQRRSKGVQLARRCPAVVAPAGLGRRCLTVEKVGGKEVVHSRVEPARQRLALPCSASPPALTLQPSPHPRGSRAAAPH